MRDQLVEHAASGVWSGDAQRTVADDHCQAATGGGERWAGGMCWDLEVDLGNIAGSRRFRRYSSIAVTSSRDPGGCIT